MNLRPGPEKRETEERERAYTFVKGLSMAKKLEGGART